MSIALVSTFAMPLETLRTDMEKKFAIDAALVRALLQYLSLGRPLEVARLVVALESLQEITVAPQDSEGNPDKIAV